MVKKQGCLQLWYLICSSFSFQKDPGLALSLFLHCHKRIAARPEKAFVAKGGDVGGTDDFSHHSHKNGRVGGFEEGRFLEKSSLLPVTCWFGRWHRSHTVSQGGIHCSAFPSADILLCLLICTPSPKGDDPVLLPASSVTSWGHCAMSHAPWFGLSGPERSFSSPRSCGLKGGMWASCQTQNSLRIFP